MSKVLKIRGVEPAIAVVALSTLVIEPAWASFSAELPGPAVGVLAAGAVIGVVVVARWWRRR